MMMGSSSEKKSKKKRGVTPRPVDEEAVPLAETVAMDLPAFVPQPMAPTQYYQTPAFQPFAMPAYQPMTYQQAAYMQPGQPMM